MLLIGVLIFMLGLIFKLFPPRKINYWYGHRTNFSMKNQDTWDEAQRYSTKTMLIFGALCAVLGFVFNFLLSVDQGVQSIVFFLGLLAMVVLDEVHLRKVFNDDGSRKIP